MTYPGLLQNRLRPITAPTWLTQRLELISHPIESCDGSNLLGFIE
jgi:hypothetical protein